jgi:hypothetical protein
MDALQIDVAKLRRDAGLDQSIADVDKIIAQLEGARTSIVNGRMIPFPKDVPVESSKTTCIRGYALSKINL